MTRPCFDAAQPNAFLIMITMMGILFYRGNGISLVFYKDKSNPRETDIQIVRSIINYLRVVIVTWNMRSEKNAYML